MLVLRQEPAGLEEEPVGVPPGPLGLEDSERLGGAHVLGSHATSLSQSIPSAAWKLGTWRAGETGGVVAVGRFRSA